jgi:hypothetical protein
VVPNLPEATDSLVSKKSPGQLWSPPCLLSNAYGVHLPELKRPGREIGLSPPSNADVNEWSYTSSPPICLQVVDMDNFTFICGLNRLFFIFTDGKYGSHMSAADIVVVKKNAFVKIFSSGTHTVSDTVLCQRRPQFKVVPTLTVSKPGRSDLCC